MAEPGGEGIQPEAETEECEKSEESPLSEFLTHEEILLVPAHILKKIETSLERRNEDSLVALALLQSSKNDLGNLACVLHVGTNMHS